MSRSFAFCDLLKSEQTSRVLLHQVHRDGYPYGDSGVHIHYKAKGVLLYRSVEAVDVSVYQLSGANVYAIISSPRSSGTEATVISAPWLSFSGDDVVNARGVSMLLTMARFLKRSYASLVL